eukprot:CAMPEP_0172480428 /NCGR_PEP_ID=MMETSP1066-20121228/5532_1 /TAXON_ID=671091 /ORGANISM="Coscinodiscus wailesii, Strain CCMP2513" /LENGTH=158 /DNA_ID=CAMNT_0013241707 /DNA_START=37 /DNA_END=512 /DNA_ORIENTATION=+
MVKWDVKERQKRRSGEKEETAGAQYHKQQKAKVTVPGEVLLDIQENKEEESLLEDNIVKEMEQVMVDGRLERWFHDLRDIQDGDDDEEDEEEEAIDDVLCETDDEEEDEIFVNVTGVLQGRRGQSSEDDQRFFSISDEYNKYELPLPENNPPQENLDK